MEPILARTMLHIHTLPGGTTQLRCSLLMLSGGGSCPPAHPHTRVNPGSGYTLDGTPTTHTLTPNPNLLIHRDTCVASTMMFTPERHLPTPGHHGHNPQRHTAASTAD